jgi:hypothetical protein
MDTGRALLEHPPHLIAAYDFKAARTSSRHETKLTPDEIIFPFFEAIPKQAKVNPKPQGRPIFATRSVSI